MTSRNLAFRAASIVSFIVALATSSALAAPLVLEETTRLAPPEPDFVWIPPASTSMVAADGDRIAAAAFKPFDLDRTQAVFLFERAANGTWSPVKLFEVDNPQTEITKTITVDLKGNTVAVVSDTRLLVYERSASGWSQTANLILQGANPGPDVAVGDGFIVVGSTALVNGVRHAVGLAYRKNAAGQWAYLASLMADETGGFIHETFAPNVEISGNSILLAHYRPVSPGVFEVAAHIYEGTPGAWSRTAILTEPPNFKPIPRVAFNGNEVMMIGAPLAGPSKTALFVRSGGTWTYDTSSSQIGSPEQVRVEMTDIAAIGAGSGAVLLGLYTDEDRCCEGGSVLVYKRGVNGEAGYRPVAKLFASDATQQLGLGRGVDISGNRVVATPAEGNSLYVFDLPTDFTQPNLVLDDFQDNNANGWLSTPGGAWSVAAGSVSRVYRQSSVAADAVSVRNGADWTNQSIQVDVKPTAASGADRWFGLSVRQSDASNYYYVTVRTSNVVHIKKMVNGSFVTLASAPLPVSLNRTYSLRFEAIGTWLRAYVDGTLLVQAQDSSLTHGQAGLRMYKVAAEYDNVVISPNPSSRLFMDSFDIFFDRDNPDYVPPERRQWITTGSGAWTVVDETDTYHQTSPAADARAIAGIDVDDQVVQAQLRATSFNGSDRWFGLMTRYRDDANYYYVTLRSSNQISLRRLINGSLSVLDSAPLTVTPGTWFTVRMENIGTALRVYVNGQLMLEANDATFREGRYGLATYKTAAEFENMLVKQP